METCSICLEEIKKGHIVKKLSCGHNYHFCCYKNLVYKHGNLYVNCPLCREMNINIDKPFDNDHKRNILMMCHGGVGKLRCLCNTKNGRRCKNKSYLMNYGKCYSHNKDIIKEEYFELYSNYMYHVLCSNYDWQTIIYLIDVGKKVMLKYLNKDSSVTDILQYFYRYLNDKEYRKNNKTHYMNGIYAYYDLKKVPRTWLDYCVNKNVII
jgi:hypothetical protein